MSRPLVVLAAVLIASPLSRAAAQEPQPLTAPTAASARPQPYRQTLGLNPLGLPFGLISAEYERALQPAFAFGIGGSLYFPTDGDSHEEWVDGKLLYYPNEVPLRGFSVGLTVGYRRATGGPSELFSVDTTRRTQGAATVGVILDYDWRIGRSKRFLVGAGLGAKRTLKYVDTSVSPLLPIYPDGRLTLGYAF